MEAPNLRLNQNTRKDTTTNPPPKESSANRAASRATVPFDRTRGNLGAAVSIVPASTRFERRKASAAQASPMTG